MNNHPPKPGRRILRWIFGDRYFDEISGDLEELYHERLEARGKLAADVHYFIDVLLSLRNIKLRRKPEINPGMIRNLTTIAFRSLKKRKSYSLLNIAGLATSTAFALLLWLYVADQTSYDKHFALADRIYRVNLETNMNGKQDVYSNAPQPIGAALRSDFSQIEDVMRIDLSEHKGTLEFKEKKIFSNNFIIAEASVLRFFERNFLEGNPSNALSEPGCVVVSAAVANDLFGQQDVLGKVVHFREYDKVLKITGVMEDDDRRTHFPMDVIVSSATFPGNESDQWYGFHIYTYILLNKENDIATLQAQIPAFYERYMKETFDKFNGTAKLHFQPLTNIYLDEELVWEPNPHGSKTNVLALSIVAILLIAFAVINYVNLATAQAADRATEVSIRKTMGSSRSLLLGQFLVESILLATASSLVAVGLAWGLLPYFNQLSGVELNTGKFFAALNLKVVLLSTLGVGLLAGIFPAFYLSSSPALSALKGKFVVSSTGEVLRRILVTGQYFIAALLISSILLVYDQVVFIKNKDIGFAKENLLNIKVPRDSVVNNHIDVYANSIKTLPNVLSTSLASIGLHRESNNFSPTLENEDGSQFQMGSDLIWVDADFLPTIGAEIVTGRNFDKRISTESDISILINEAAAKKFGWTKNPLGGKFAGFTPTEPWPMNVIGVVKDFHIGVSYQLVHPTIIFMSHGGESSLYVRMANDNVASSVEVMKEKWDRQFPGYNFEYSFVDADLNSLYNRDDNFLSLLTCFCVVIVFIASLGIIGLISYTTEFRKKEIAIRKVLGSSLGQIVNILTKKFVFLVIIANILAVPATWYLIREWLSNFAYRVDINPAAFVAPFVICLLFTGLSIGYHTGRAALANPVDALKCE
jgi:putative ABC transport system permease protein